MAKQLPLLSDVRECDTSVVHVSVRDVSGYSIGQCDTWVVVENCIVVGPVESDMAPRMMAQDLCVSSLNQSGEDRHMGILGKYFSSFQLNSVMQV